MGPITATITFSDGLQRAFVCPPSFDQIVQGIAWIEQQLQHNRTIYIHCAVGVGRSATLLACWFLYAQQMNVAEAIRFLKSRRPQVGLTRIQVRRLEAFEGWLGKNAGTISAPLARS